MGIGCQYLEKDGLIGRHIGFIYPKETILEYCRFCERHNLHLYVIRLNAAPKAHLLSARIVDEIYALSLYKNKSALWSSLTQIGAKFYIQTFLRLQNSSRSCLSMYKPRLNAIRLAYTSYTGKQPMFESEGSIVDHHCAE